MFSYLDDIIIVSATFEEHLQHLAEVFRHLCNARLYLNPEKCLHDFCLHELKYLRHVVDHRASVPIPKKLSHITVV